MKSGADTTTTSRSTKEPLPRCKGTLVMQLHDQRRFQLSRGSALPSLIQDVPGEQRNERGGDIAGDTGIRRREIALRSHALPDESNQSGGCSGEVLGLAIETQSPYVSHVHLWLREQVAIPMVRRHRSRTRKPAQKFEERCRRAVSRRCHPRNLPVRGKLIINHVTIGRPAFLPHNSNKEHRDEQRWPLAPG